MLQNLKTTRDPPAANSIVSSNAVENSPLRSIEEGQESILGFGQLRWNPAPHDLIISTGGKILCLCIHDFSALLPEETARVRGFAFPKGNPYMTLATGRRLCL